MHATICQVEFVLYTLVVADTLLVWTYQALYIYNLVVVKRLCALLCPLQESVDECHTHKFTILHLAEICGAWVGINLLCNLVYAWKRMQYSHLLLRQCHLLSIENVAILHTLILSLVRETLLLNASHIEDIQLAHNLL